MDISKIANMSQEEQHAEANKFREWHARNVVDYVIKELNKVDDLVMIEHGPSMRINISIDTGVKYVPTKKPNPKKKKR